MTSFGPHLLNATDHVLSTGHVYTSAIIGLAAQVGARVECHGIGPGRLAGQAGQAGMTRRFWAGWGKRSPGRPATRPQILLNLAPYFPSLLLFSITYMYYLLGLHLALHMVSCTPHTHHARMHPIENSGEKQYQPS